jgi:glycerol-3-phosphate dehydrogenase (NAD(P)+)
MKVGIIGAGAWGRALAVIASRAGNDVLLWTHDANIEIDRKHRKSRLPGVIISHEILATGKLSDLSVADVWLIATPTEFFRSVVRKSRPFWQKQSIIICSKGIEPNTGKLLSEVLADAVPGSEKFIGVLAGPQFAAEAAAGKPTGSTIAGREKVRESARRALAGIYFENSDDIAGVQVCGAGKNVVAMLLGYLGGCGAGENEKALKLTFGWQEIMRFGRLFGAKEATFGMLCGIGDLFLSASSRTSRNYLAGFELGRAERSGVFGRKSSDGVTIEGVAALKWIVKIARANKVSLPVLEEFAKVSSALRREAELAFII